MKVRITDLPLDGLVVRENLNLDSLKARLQEGEQSVFTILQAPAVEIRLLPLGQDGAQVSGFITAAYKQECALCLEQAPRDVRLPVEFQIRVKPAATGNDQFEDDVGMVFVDDETVELDESLEEIFILSLDIFWHPDFDSNTSAKCSTCKKTRQQIGVLAEEPKSTLGDLLKLSGLGKK